MEGQTLIIGSIIIVLVIVSIVLLHLIRKMRINKYRGYVRVLEREKNLVASTPVLLELSKIEPLIKNENIENQYNEWQERFKEIKESRLTVIDDMIIDLDALVEKRDYKNSNYRLAKIEMEIYKVKEQAEELLEEIKEITLSEEKYRAIVTKLKTKYRKLSKEYSEHKNLYDDMQEAIELQLENIEKRFMNFETVMEKNEYSEVVHIVKALDNMIDHMGIIVEETPDLLLMGKQLIPKRVKEIKDIVKEMTESGYPLEYLNIDYNIKEAKKNIGKILDRVKVLNLEDCMFELKTILDYLDSLFVDFEKERLSRKVFEEIEKDFKVKLEKTNGLVKEVFDQLDDIKNMYDLKEEDVSILVEVNKTLVVINDDYKKIVAKVGVESSPYSILNIEIEELIHRLKTLEEELDRALKSLGNMYDDEVRAREQLEEIESFLKQCRKKMREYKLPIISDHYFVELAEANDAIKEVIKELQKKPIVIKTLNTRVDTARDLVLKLYNTTNEMVKTAKLAEMSIVYGNRYRMSYDGISDGLDQATEEYFKGNYKNSLDISIKTTKLVDENIYRKMLDVYDN